jgi:tRNA(Ile2) C34 agmatinyltransferase TiaS
MTKSVAIPIREVTRHDRIHGLVQEYKDVTQDVLLVEGEIHDGKRPGFVFFTTDEARDKFARIVLQDVQVSERVHALAQKAVWRMNQFNDGRTWMAGHMRRGDCKRFLTRVLCSLY